MKIKSYYIGKPIPGICKQNAIWGCDGKSSMPLVYLQRPKWITDDKAWDKICASIEFHAPYNLEINVG